MTVAMSAMMMNNPTRKTMLTVTMSMMTTMTTVLHRDLENDQSSVPFSSVHVACIQGVLWSSQCCWLLLDWVAPCVGLYSDASLHEYLRNSSFPTLICQISSISVCVYLVRACAFDIARPLCSAPRLFRDSIFLRNRSILLLF